MTIVRNGSDPYQRLSADNQRWGVVFGLLAGLTFAAGAWGMDAYSLSQAHAELPWLHLAIGLVFCLPLAMLAGWVTGWSDNGLVSAVAWALVIGAVIWFAGHLPYEISSKAIQWLDGDFQGLTVYPFPESAKTRWIIAVIVGVVLALISGGLGAMAVSNLRTNSGLSRGLLTLLCALLLAIGGVFADSIINQPLRTPLVQMDRLIELYQSYQGQVISSQQARELRFGVLRPLDALVSRPRRLVLADYEVDTLETVRVYIQFGDTWALCSVITEQPSFCQESNEIYIDALACTWQDSAGCRIQVQEAAQASLQTIRGSQTPPAVQIRQQRGIYSLVAINQEGQEFECLLRDQGKLSLESCRPAGQASTDKLPATSRATATADSVSPELATWQAAILPASQPDIARLRDLTHYNLQMTLGDDGCSFAGQATITYTNTESVSLEQIVLRLLPNGGNSYGNGRLEITPPITINGQAVQVDLQDTDRSILVIPLAGGLPVGQAIRLELSFHGEVPLDFGGEATPHAYGIYNYSDNVLALSGWYPILAVYDEQGWRTDRVAMIGDSVYSEMAFYDVAISAPADWVVAATGMQVDEANISPTQIRHIFVSGPARDFFIAASPDFKVASQRSRETTVNSYYLPGNENGGNQALQVGVESIEIFNKNFGLYPYNELDIIQAPMRNAGGVEFPGIVLIEAGRYDEPGNPAFITTVAHEAAHQWWYNIVGNDVFSEPWLDEGLTTYSSILYYEFAMGREAYQEALGYYQGRYDSLAQAQSDDRVTNSLDYFEANYPERYGAVVYAKAALFFDAVRKGIGDKAFFSALQEYYRSKQYQVARGKDLLNAFKKAAGRPLDDLYEQWLYQP